MGWLDFAKQTLPLEIQAWKGGYIKTFTLAYWSFIRVGLILTYPVWNNCMWLIRMIERLTVTKE